MFCECILVKPGEIALKGLNKGRFMQILQTNIHAKLKSIGQFSITNSGSVFVIQEEGEDHALTKAFDQLTHVFGISKLCKAKQCEKELDAIKLCCLQVATEQAFFNTFKVEAKRIDKRFMPTSRDLCVLVGDWLLQKKTNIKVDVHNPELTITIDVRHDYVFCAYARSEGAGGLPVGCTGKGTVLLSGGIDSPVAAFMMAKRGMKISCTHFASPPYTSELAHQKVVNLVLKLNTYCGRTTLHTVEITKIQETIKKHCSAELLTILLRRFMLRIAQDIAQEQGEGGLVTGESLGQVASQTLESITCTNAVCSLPVFRPLIGMDKKETIKIAQAIGTYDISIQPFADCCTLFLPKHPQTRPQIPDVVAAEQGIKDLLLDANGTVKPETFRHTTERIG
ncbi:MAG: tRNA 4-thiouridine(8) synthase ThiI [Oscillospiraceae bacterium]|jgi:thiamine biosynthesis protein ThiI|nr:tRNA 4-thiouridine(8) synthase ThiI [Oscillospiraceae bacterium]